MAKLKTGKSITSGDYKLFNNMWLGLVETRDRRLQGEIKKLSAQGYGTSDIESLLTENPTFSQNINNLMNYTSPESQQFYAGFQPKKSKGFMGRMSESPLATSGVIAGTMAAPGLAYAGYEWANMPSAELKEAAMQIYNNELNASRNEVKDALDQLTNRNHYYVKCCNECGHKVRKKTTNDPTRPKITVTAIAKELGMSRQSIYMLINQPKIELMRFLELQKILKCQILNERDINLYTDYLKSLLIIP